MYLSILASELNILACTVDTHYNTRGCPPPVSSSSGDYYPRVTQGSNFLIFLLSQRVCVSTRDNMLLTRISVWNGNINILLSPTSIYMFHIPGSSYVLFSTVKAAYKKYVFKVKQKTFIFKFI